MKELNELRRAMEFESRTNGRIPRPYYLYVANYGRRASEYEEQFKLFSGKQESFYFKPTDDDEKAIQNAFENEINRKKPIGKEYDGVIFIDLSEVYAEGDNLNKFLTYLREYHNNNYIVFEIDSSDKADAMMKIIGNHFFVRSIEAPEYTKEEKLELVTKVIAEYSSSFTGRALNELLKWVIANKWDKSDSVVTRLTSVTKSILYEMGINDKTISGKRVKEIIEKEIPVKANKIVFGFQLEG